MYDISKWEYSCSLYFYMETSINICLFFCFFFFSAEDDPYL